MDAVSARFSISMTFANTILRENGLSRPAKGGSTPAFACQRAAQTNLSFQLTIAWKNKFALSPLFT